MCPAVGPGTSSKCAKRQKIQVKRKRWCWIRSVGISGVTASRSDGSQSGLLIVHWFHPQQEGCTHDQHGQLSSLLTGRNKTNFNKQTSRDEEKMACFSASFYVGKWRHLVFAHGSLSVLPTDLWPSAAPSDLQGLSCPWTCCLCERSSQRDSDQLLNPQDSFSHWSCSLETLRHSRHASQAKVFDPCPSIFLVLVSGFLKKKNLLNKSALISFIYLFSFL